MIPAAFEEGVRLFNSGRYFECHEALEALWLEAPAESRDLYQGLIQTAVAFHHAERGNPEGARKCLARGLGHLKAFRGRKVPIDLKPLIEAIEKALDLVQGGRDIPRPFPRLKLLASSENS